jgi:hypothetical protein
MASAGFAVPRSLFPLPIPPRYANGRYPYCCLDGYKYGDQHCDNRDKGFSHRGSLATIIWRRETIGLASLRLVSDGLQVLQGSPPAPVGHSRATPPSRSDGEMLKRLVARVDSILFSEALAEEGAIVSPRRANWVSKGSCRSGR